MKTAAVI